MKLKNFYIYAYQTATFSYNNNIHTLEDSGTIGLALIVIMAESFLQYHQSNAIAEFLILAPPIELK